MATFTTSNGFSVLIDDEDTAVWHSRTWRFQQRPNGNNYVIAKAPRTHPSHSLHLHREILQPPDGLYVDHINGDVLDNRRENLRIVTNSQNQQNRHKPNGRSRFKGVAWHEQAGKWQVQIKLDYQSRYIGVFDDEVEAARAYDAAACDLFGDFACLNFPREAV